MDERIEIWNILHDGEITAVSDESMDPIHMFVSIPFLRRRLQPLGDSFVLTLSGISDIRMRDFSGIEGSLAEELEVAIPQLLWTSSETMPLTIETTAGKLILHFDGLQVRLDTGEPTSFETIRNACEEYWNDLRKRAGNGVHSPTES